MLSRQLRSWNGLWLEGEELWVLLGQYARHPMYAPAGTQVGLEDCSRYWTVARIEGRTHDPKRMHVTAISGRSARSEDGAGIMHNHAPVMLQAERAAIPRRRSGTASLQAQPVGTGPPLHRHFARMVWVEAIDDTEQANFDTVRGSECRQI
ncbi:hypothetical protein PsYK624_154630 [Phanerochaete sordida]|uniref:Uncharacterized protein n=1 Tax=Phanerochaete sordida TaxID=48140 RepID=A0A9P3GTA4_9APHY|nr:hypothetical protein PsYK624_154630 [Phanerochaete sordida]